jgi:hypothetical protein
VVFDGRVVVERGARVAGGAHVGTSSGVSLDERGGSAWSSTALTSSATAPRGHEQRRVARRVDRLDMVERGARVACGVWA